MSYDLKASVQTVAGEIRISNVATEIKVGDTALLKRHQLKFRNESSYEMYYCFNETDCVYSSDAAVRLRSGDTVILDLDRDIPTQVWAVAKIDSVPMEIVEVR